MSKKKDYSAGSVDRSIARGAFSRGTTGINNNGVDSYKQHKKSTKGHYKIAFMNTYENMTEKDIELRIQYGKELVAQHIGVPFDMITLKPKRIHGKQTLTSLDEVFYVRVGSDVAGKLSIRTQRTWKTTSLIIIFQEKKIAPKPPQKAFSRKVGFKKRSKSQISQSKRDSYHRRKR